MELSPVHTVYLLASTSALLWGTTPILSKRGLAGGGTPAQAACTLVLVDSALFWVALVVRQGTDLFAGLTPRTLVIFAAAGVMGTALGRIGIFAGIDRVGASLNRAVVSSRPVFATLLAFVFLAEPVSLTTAFGILVLVCGLTVLALSRGGDLGGWRPRELLVPLAAAGCLAVGNVLRREGLQSSPTTTLEAVVINETVAMVVLGSYLLAAHGGDLLAGPRRSYLYFTGSGLLTAGALISLFTALSLPAGRVAVVDSLAATAPLFTVALSHFFLADLERVTGRLVVGAALVVLGAVFVTAAPDVLA